MAIEIRQLFKKFESKVIFDSADFDFPDGVTALMGGSGIGKTTLLRIIAGLDKDFKGEISGSENISYCPQSTALLPWYSARKNLEVFLGRSDDMNAKIDEALNETGLCDAADKKPHELSGGMAQRVAIIRAWLFPSDTVILDEPFKGLDSETKSLVITYLKNTLKDGRTVIFTTHSEDEANEFADRIITI